MVNKVTYKLPIGLLLLDIIGTCLFALGIAKLVANMDILPINEWLAGTVFENYGIVFVVLGVVLIAPFSMHVFTRMRTHTEERLRK